MAELRESVVDVIVHRRALLAKLLYGQAFEDAPVRSDTGHLLKEALPAEAEGQLSTGQVLHVLEDIGNYIVGQSLL